jgi:4-amino-4-deoxy-L-arabinose transferase-like glycosyltransferase
MTLRHGSAFLQDFFLKHHFSRFVTDALQHEQPFWFYLPVLVAGLFPWTPLVALLFRKSLFEDARLRFLLLWVAFGLVFFSTATNKLPGYLLPLIPAACALMGVALAEAKDAKWPLVASAALLALVPIVAGVLPEALLRGLSHARVADVAWLLFPPVAAVIATAWVAERAGRRRIAAGAIVAAIITGVFWLETTTFPPLDRTVSARGLWRQIASRSGEVCVDNVNRGWRYGLNYYSSAPLPDCEEAPRPIRIRSGPGDVPQPDFGAANAF